MNEFRPLARETRNKVTIESVTETQNSYGEPIETFATYAKRWAKIVYKTGAETFNGYQDVVNYKVIFIFRYDSLTKAITEKMRISYNSRYYDIEAVINPFERNKEIRVYGRDQRT